MSNETFKVGDVVEILPRSANPDVRHCIGMEGTIQELNVDRMHDGTPCHGIITSNGDSVSCSERALRKKRPPREPTSSWDDVIVWRPKELSHV